MLGKHYFTGDWELWIRMPSLKETHILSAHLKVHLSGHQIHIYSHAKIYSLQFYWLMAAETSISKAL